MINESKEGYKVLKDLNRIHKLELEIQDIQRTVIELLDRLRNHKIGSKEREDIEKRISKFLEEKDEMSDEIGYEMRIFRQSVASIDTERELEIDKFFN